LFNLDLLLKTFNEAYFIAGTAVHGMSVLGDAFFAVQDLFAPADLTTSNQLGCYAHKPLPGGKTREIRVLHSR
jgi:hypothetical protein